MGQQTAKAMTNGQLIGACVELDRGQKRSRALMNSYRAELQARGLALMEDHNVRYVKFYGDGGSAAIMDSMSLDILNPDKLKELVGEGVYNMKVREDTKTSYKFDSKFEKALKAIFTGDYTFETTLVEFLGEMSIKPDERQKKLLLKKLKGEFEKDKETLISVLVQEGQETPDFDVELWYIYRIKNGELIRAFLPEEMIDATIEGIRKSILVETKTSITLDYDKEKGGVTMAGQTRDILSEHTKDMTLEQRAGLQEKVSSMTGEELWEFRNSLAPDSMGFFGEESV